MNKRFIKLVHDVFSRRNSSSKKSEDVVHQALRKKMIFLCNDIFSNRYREFSSRDYRDQFWQEIHHVLMYRHGKALLSDNSDVFSIFEDTLQYLLNCQGAEFLDFLELVFRIKCIFHVTHDENEIVDSMNEMLNAESAPYQLTNIVKKEMPNSIHPRGGRTIETIAYPKIIRKEESTIYKEAIMPALETLEEPSYESANLEFREALEDYRRGDFGDCLTKNCSAFESVMKIICKKNLWKYSEQDTSQKLLNIILDNTSLPKFFEQPLILIATIRNRLSKSHGAGSQIRKVPSHIAQYSINATASAIVLLVKEAGK